MNAKSKIAVESLASSIGSERNVIERIRSELDKRGWTQAELSRRMEAFAEGSAGGVLHPVVLSKLLKGDGGRHVSIDQLVTLAGVFEVSVSEMLLPPDAMEMASVLRALAEGPQLQTASVLATESLRSAQDLIAEAMAGSSFWVDHVADEMERAVETAERRGLPLSDSVRWAFLAGVVERYDAMKDGSNG